MRHRTFRIRRGAVALATVIGTVGAVVAGTAGVASATVDSVANGTISSATPTSIASTGSNQAAANLTVGFGSGTHLTGGSGDDTLILTVGASAGGPTAVVWTAVPTISSSGITVGSATLGGSGTTLTIPLGADSGVASIIISNVAYTTDDATGTLTVTPTLGGSNTPTGTFSPSAVSNATLPATPPSAPTIALTASTTPDIGAGLASQAAGNWVVAVSGSTSEGWEDGYDLAITVADDAGDNCSGNDYIEFAAAPTAAVVTTGFGSSTAPTVGTPSLAYLAPCGANEPNTVLVPFTNTGTLPSSASFTVTVSGVKFTTGSAVATSYVSVTGLYESSAGVEQVAMTTTGATLPATTGPSDASVSTVVPTADSPAVTVNTGALGSAISPISLTESTSGAVPDGWVCLTLSATGSSTTVSSTGSASQNAFASASTPKVAVSSGSGTVNSTADFETVGSTGTTDNTLAFDVTTSFPETTASTYEVSNLAVNNTGSTVGAVYVIVSDGVAAATDCPSTGTGTVGFAEAYSVGKATGQIYGADADGTAAAELEAAFPYQSGICPGAGGASLTGGYAANRPVVLATDSNYPDALAAAYLARELGTGELLTPTNSVSPETLIALRLEGISEVYVVGGPYVISNADIAELKATPVYTCGGQNQVFTLLGTAQDIAVTQIYGPTEYDTAQDIAEYPGPGVVGKVAFAGAYSGVNSSSGDGMYNDTSGTASTSAASSGAVPTAILATGTGFQDAESASALAYADGLPILLTTPSALSTQAQAALTALGIKQVIVMGGPLAVSNTVVTSLQGLGVSVLRVAGTDYTNTATELAEFEVNTQTGGLGLGWSPDGAVYVARGDFYTDGLAGAVVTGTGATSSVTNCTAGSPPGIAGGATPSTCTYTHAAPLLLTENPTTVGTYLTTFLDQAGSSTGIDQLGSSSQITAINVLGGPLAVTPATISTMESDLAAG